MRILSLDPGKKTGYCIANISKEENDIQLVKLGTVEQLGDLAGLFSPKPDVVIVERYFQADQSFDLVVSEATGAIRMLAFQAQVGVVKQEPYIPKYIFTRYFGCKNPKHLVPDMVKGIHSIEALYHLLHYVSKDLKMDIKSFVNGLKAERTDNNEQI